MTPIQAPRAAAKASRPAVPGRCIYCDERCEATQFFHHHCRQRHQPGLPPMEENPVPIREAGGVAEAVPRR